MAPAGTIDIAAVIEGQKLGRFQIGLASILLLCMFVDGFEAQAPGFAAPALIHAWHLSRAAMGPVFGAGNFGLMLGAVILGVLGDRLGRRRTILAGLLILAAASFATMQAKNLHDLLVLRVVAGVGVGGVLPASIALGVEFSPKRFQAMAVWVMLIGYQAGASSGALVSTLLIPAHGWQVMFAAGGILPLAAGLAVLGFLPESLRFLALDPARRAAALRVLGRLAPGLSPGAETHLIHDEEKQPGFRLAHLFREGRAGVTLLLWFVFLANLMALQFLLTWLPTVLESPAVPRNIAAIATVLAPAGGIVGGLAISRLLDRGGARPVAIALLLGVPLVALIGAAAQSPALLMLATFGAGCSIIGGQTNLHAMAGKFYPTFIRANGIGWANGIGRIGSVAGPVIGGVLIGLDLPVSQLFLCVAVAPLCAALGCFALAQLQSRAGSTVAAQTGESPLVARTDGSF